mmetsp:Transcript_18104/g.56759  ORF Transcript_18104/g.56759 Transcript_18104/m.56759 type:complete len:232 (+) Transcript_18104:3848-4543(+)
MEAGLLRRGQLSLGRGRGRQGGEGWHPVESNDHVLEAPLAHPVEVKVVPAHLHVVGEGQRRPAVELEIRCGVEGTCLHRLGRARELAQGPAPRLLAVALVGEVGVALHLNLLLLLLVLLLLRLLLAALLCFDLPDAFRRAHGAQNVSARLCVLGGGDKVEEGIAALSEHLRKGPRHGHALAHLCVHVLEEHVERAVEARLHLGRERGSLALRALRGRGGGRKRARGRARAP